nr:unnamed protein product [Spirometra erinaceieuropaei]
MRPTASPPPKSNAKPANANYSSSPHQRSTAPMLPTVLADAPGTNHSYWTSPNEMQHPDYFSRCPPVLAPHANPSSYPPPPSSTIFPALTSDVATPAITTTAQNPDALSNSNLIPANPSHVDSIHTYPHYDRTFTSRINLVEHLRIHRTEIGKLMSGAPPTPAASASTVHTAPAYSPISLAY